MKPPKKKTPKPLGPRERADQIGQAYEEGKDLIAIGTAKTNVAKEEGNTLADNVGEETASGKGKKVIGRKFEVGYFVRAGSFSFDEEAFARKYPKLWSQCAPMKRVFDPDMLKALVDKGTITKKIIKEFTQIGGSTKVAKIERLKQE